MSLRAQLIALGVRLMQQPFWILSPFFMLAIGATIAVSHHFFFWDTAQLGAEHGLFFYENGLTAGLLPENMDSGHPPIFGWYLAAVWRLFGATLAVSHGAMLPFLGGILLQAWLLGRRILGDGFAFFWLLALCCHPVVAAQCLLISPDVVLLFFFLLALNGLYLDRKLYLSIGILGLCLISMRGMMVAAGLFIADIWVFNAAAKTFRGQAWQVCLKGRYYVLGVGAAGAFLLWHYIKKGWLGYHGGSAWATAFERAQGWEWVKNMAIMAWRLMDFGTVGFWGLAMSSFWPKKRWQWAETRRLQTILVAVAGVLLPILMAYRGLLSHRYLLPIYVLIVLLGLKTISDFKSVRQQYIALVGCGLMLFSGHFWVYPQPIATGWDATTAHLPYYGLQTELCDFIRAEKIDWTTVGSHFPNIRPRRLTHLATDSTANWAFNRVDFDKNTYIFYSNVMNDFSKDDLNRLEKEWTVVKSLKKGAVWVCLYKRK